MNTEATVIPTSSISLTRASLMIARLIMIWVAVVACGLLMLYGRYNWDPSVSMYSWRGFLSSAYMFVLVLPTFYYTLAHFVHNQRVVLLTTSIVAIVCTLPYRWLGLDQFYYYQSQDYSFLDVPGAGFYGSPDLKPDWFPEAFSNLPVIPYEAAFFATLFLVGVLISIAYWQKSKASLTKIGYYFIIGGLVVYSLILFQTWLHLSLRSPYTYVAHFQEPAEKHFWYHVYTFPGHMGAVEGDYFVFRALEEHFSGVPYKVNLMLIRRSSFFYFTSQFSYFINGLYVGIVFNILFWFCAVVCGYLFTSRIWSSRVAVFSALFIAGGSGYIVYAGQPMSYLPGFAMTIITIYLFDRLMITHYTLKNIMLFGCLLGIGLMIYDIAAICVFLLIYSLIKKVKLYATLSSFAIAGAIYSSFMFIQLDMLHITVDQSNVQEATKPLTVIIGLIGQAGFDKWYELTISGIEMYFGHLTKVFLILPIILAIYGSMFVGNKTQKIIVFSLFLPSFLVFCYMHYGGTYIAELPRFTYAAFPAIYILAALGLDRVASIRGSRIRDAVGSYGPWMMIIAFFILNNIDVFGFPSIYYYFFWTTPGYW